MVVNEAVMAQTILLLDLSTSVQTLKAVLIEVADGTVTAMSENGLGLTSKIARAQGSLRMMVTSMNLTWDGMSKVFVRDTV